MTTDRVRDYEGNFMPSVRLGTPDPTIPRSSRRLPGTRSMALATAGMLALTGLVAVAPGASATTTSAARAAVALGRTTVTGWSTAPADVATGAAPAVRFRVTSAHTGVRTVMLQRRRVGTVVWTVIAKASTTSAGWVTLKLPVPTGHWQFRAYVPATKTAAMALSGIRVLTGVLNGPVSAMAKDMLRQVNAARAVPRMCGTTRYPAAPALAYSTALERAAVGHAVDMATHNYFSHTSPSGSTPTSRAKSVGYRGVAGENIAAGYPSVAAVMAGWLKSPGHCSNIMSRSYQDLGVGSAYSAKSTYGSYWVQDFGIRG
jgi:uncharacterized protein YkwD